MREIFDFDLFLLVNTLITTRMWLCFCKELKKKIVSVPKTISGVPSGKGKQAMLALSDLKTDIMF